MNIICVFFIYLQEMWGLRLGWAKREQVEKHMNKTTTLDKLAVCLFQLYKSRSLIYGSLRFILILFFLIFMIVQENITYT